MNLMDSDPFLLALNLYLDLTVSANRIVQLRYLIILWIVRIEVILSVTLTVLY